MTNLLENYQENAFIDLKHHIANLTRSGKLSDELISFEDKGAIHDAYIQQLSYHFFEKELDVTLVSQDGEMTYQFQYSGVDFSKSVLPLENELQCLADMICLEDRYMTHEMVCSSVETGLQRLFIVCQEIELVETIN